MPRPVVSLAVAFALAVAGCGADPAPAPPEVPATWRAARDDARPGAVEVDVQSPVPCLAVLRLRDAQGGVVLERRRPLAAGEACRLWAAVTARVEPDRAASIAAQDRSRGRTEPWMLSATMGWDGAVIGARHQLLATRPGGARVLGPWHVLAPTGPQRLPWSSERDLTALALTDGAPEAVLEGREHGSRLQGADGAAAGDQALLLRVTLALERDAQ
jgi:hypothetical protein